MNIGHINASQDLIKNNNKIIISKIKLSLKICKL